MAAKNFSFVEISALTNLVDKYKNIIECKQTSVIFNTKKEEAWNSLTDEFNAVPGVCKRTSKQLKTKYKNMKKEAQKNKSNEKVELFATGGGTQKLLLTPIDERIIAMGAINEPVPCLYDCDFEYESAIRSIREQENNSIDATVIRENPNLKPNIIEKERNVQERSENSNVEPSMPPNEMPMCIDVQANYEDATETKKAVSTPAAGVTPFRPILNKRGKRKASASLTTSEALALGAKARRLAVEQETNQLQRHREEEHAAKMQSIKLKNEFMQKEHNLLLKEHNSRMQEHNLRMQVLAAKLQYYTNKTSPQ